MPNSLTELGRAKQAEKLLAVSYPPTIFERNRHLGETPAAAYDTPMNSILPIILLLLGVGLGGVGVWLVLRAKIAAAYDRGRGEASVETAALAERLLGRDARLEELRAEALEKETTQRGLQQQVENLKTEAADLRRALVEQQKQAEEKLALLDHAKQQLADAFKALAADALKSSNTSFLELAKTQLEKFQELAKGDLDKRQVAIDELVKPVKESLGKVDAKLQEIEKSRIEAYSGLTEQVKSLSESQKELRGETANLVKALRRPQARGRWGEIQLRRVVEMAGMLSHCDFVEQQSTDTESGRLRPDLVVQLPGNKKIVVDSKAPLQAYLEAIEAPDDETRAAKFKDHARQVRNHITQLGRKSYFEQFDFTPEFVVLFLPGEVFFSAALENDPELIELGVSQNVIVATPTTLIALLRAVAYGWRHEQLAENAKVISELGQELYKRIADLSDHMLRLGNGLGVAINAYNGAIGSLESRVLVSARKFKELGAATAAGKEIKEIEPIETTTRLLQASELRGPTAIDVEQRPI
jgi:DNA recombination protein RmuC